MFIQFNPCVIEFSHLWNMKKYLTYDIIKCKTVVFQTERSISWFSHQHLLNKCTSNVVINILLFFLANGRPKPLWFGFWVQEFLPVSCFWFVLWVCSVCSSWVDVVSMDWTPLQCQPRIRKYKLLSYQVFLGAYIIFFSWTRNNVYC